jgi:hypothetical protein
MDAVVGSRWERVLRQTRTLLLISVAIRLVEQVCGPARLAAARGDLLDQLQQQRGSRVIAMIQRQDTVSLFGVPVSSSIGIEDSEAVLRAIRLTPPDKPIDLINYGRTCGESAEHDYGTPSSRSSGSKRFCRTSSGE